MSSLQAQPSTSSASAPSFAELGLTDELVRAVAKEGYTRPTPIQNGSIAPVLAGRDLLGCAQTGTGKTAAFVLPILQRLARGVKTGHVRALIVAPTRELAAQIDERISAYGIYLGLRHSVIYGGVGQRAQEEALRRKPDILVATPGRLLDLMNQGFARLDKIEILVLDEADRMLDMGFIHDVRKIIAVIPKERQTLLFSATVPVEIAKLISSVLRDPVRVDIEPEVTTAQRVEQIVYHVPRTAKRGLLERIIREEKATRSIVFTRTKHGANRLAEQLCRSGIVAMAIHGNKSQGARERALEGFRTGEVPVLVATDLAARGIDVDGISHVFNYELPNVPESYVHRIGRTGRAGASGRAVAFCDAEERTFLRDIERFVKKSIPVGVLPAGVVAEASAMAAAEPPPPPRGGRHQQRPPQRQQQQQAPRPRSPQPQRPQQPQTQVARPLGAARPAQAGTATTSSDAGGQATPTGEASRRRRRYRGSRLV